MGLEFGEIEVNNLKELEKELKIARKEIEFTDSELDYAAVADIRELVYIEANNGYDSVIATKIEDFLTLDDEDE